MKTTIWVAVCICSFIACQISTTSNKPARPELATEVIEADGIGLSLNKKNKWMIDSVTLQRLYYLREKVYAFGSTMENSEISDINREAEDYGAIVASVPHSLGDHYHPQIEIMISKIKEQLELMKGENLQAAQIGVVNLSTILDQLPVYFELKND